jgi:hypothetical protein
MFQTPPPVPVRVHPVAPEVVKVAVTGLSNPGLAMKIGSAFA